jgi:hypothetical protein
MFARHAGAMMRQVERASKIQGIPKTKSSMKHNEGAAAAAAARKAKEQDKDDIF